MSWADIDKWTESYTPTSGKAPGPEVIPPGDYDLEILSAELVKTPNTGESIFRLGLRVADGEYKGRRFERVSFFRTQKNTDFLGGEMCVLGLDAAFWGKRGKLFSQELIDACPKLLGRKFRAAREDAERADGKGNYPNLFIRSLIDSPLPDGKELDKSIPF